MDLFTGVTTVAWGFDAGDIWSNGVKIFTFLAMFILLGIAINFAPRLIDLAKNSLK